MIFDATQLDAELRVAGLRIHGCASDGRVDWINPPTQAEIDIAAAVLATHDPMRRAREERTETLGFLDLADRVENEIGIARETRLGLAKFIRRMVRQ